MPEHIAQFDLPTAPPKATDNRAFTGQTVQAEALPPDTLGELVRDAIVANIDPDAYARALDAEQAERTELLAWMGAL